MIQKVLLDTGPLVAYLNARDRYHEWTVAQLSGMAAPLITCEAVISQSCFVLRNFPVAQQAVFDMIRRGLLVIPFDLVSEAEAVQKLLKRYADVPISVADACLVRMSEANWRRPSSAARKRWDATPDRSLPMATTPITLRSRRRQTAEWIFMDRGRRVGSPANATPKAAAPGFWPVPSPIRPSRIASLARREKS